MRVVLGLVLALLCWTQAEAATYYAGPPGVGLAGNNGTSAATPFTPKRFFCLPPQAGDQLWLLDGTYTGVDYMLNPYDNQGCPIPTGTSGAPIKISALNDGKVFFDGQYTNNPVRVRGWKWVILEGFNAAHANDLSVVTVSAFSEDVIIRRVIAWDAKDCPQPQSASSCGVVGQSGPDAMVWDVTTGNRRILLEDVAGFGAGRKTFQIQTSFDTIIRRAWGRAGGWNSCFSVPRDPTQFSYRAIRTLGENVIQTYNHDSAVLPNCVVGWWLFDMDNEGGSSLSSPGNPSGGDPNNPGTQRVFGSIGYIKCGIGWFGNALSFNPNHFSTATVIRDLVHVIPSGCFTNVMGADLRPNDFPPTVQPMEATRISMFGGNGSNSINSVWNPTAVAGTNTADPPAGNYGSLSSPWNPSGTNARACFRYVDGVQTTVPLWPWPMDQRIKDALAAAGKAGLTGGTVTSEIESLLGPIDAQCKGVIPPPVTGGKIQFVAASPLTAGTTSPLSISLPIGIQQDDFLLATCVSRADDAPTFTFPGGYTSRGRSVNNLSGTDLTIEVASKFAGSSESAPSVSVSSVSQGWGCYIAAYRFVDQTSPMDATATTGTNAAATSWAPPSITTTTAFALVVSLAASADNNVLAIGTPQNFIGRALGSDFDACFGTPLCTLVDLATASAELELASAGAATMLSWTQPFEGPDPWAGITLALRWNGSTQSSPTGVTNQIRSNQSTLGGTQTKPAAQIKPKS